MYQMQRIISKHQHADGLIALFPQHQMLGSVSYDFGPNQGHGTHNNTVNRYNDHSVSKGHYMNATGYYWKVGSYTDILTAALIANFDGDAGAAFVFCQVADAGVWIDGTNRYAFNMWFSGASDEIFMRRDTVNGQLYYRHDIGGRSLSMNVVGMDTTDWFCMAMMWDRLVTDKVRIYLDGAFVESGVNPGVYGADVPEVAVLGARTPEPEDCWQGGLGIAAIYNTIKSDDEMLYLSTP